MHKAQRAQPNSGDALYEHVSPALNVWVRSRVAIHFHGRLDSDDLAHEIWIRVMEALPNFDPAQGKFRPWLFGVARNVAQETLRKLSRLAINAGSVDRGEAFGNSRADVLRLSGIVQRNEMVGLFWEWFQALPDRERQLLLHMGLEARTAKQTATLLGLSEAATEKAWQRLRTRVKNDSILRNAVYFDEAI